MSDRFSGTVYLGGQLTQEQLDNCNKLVEDCLDLGGEFDDGSAHFIECVDDDFHGLVAYCKAENIALSIQWGAEFSYDGLVQYWVDGAALEYRTTCDGEIVVKLRDLQDHPTMTIGEYIERLSVPELPEFSIIETA